MKFVHIADMHFDEPFTVLNTRSNLGEKRRLEQRKVFAKIIDYIQENDIPYFFISGDLYEHKYIRQTTIQYLNMLFQKIPNTKIFIAPGNHDPNILNSMYRNYPWNENVKIFNSSLEIVEEDDVDIYGWGFDDFYCKESPIKNIKIKNMDKINILITHGSLDGGYDEYREYNPMSKKELKQLGFDYVALGHIHKKDYDSEENQRVVYPGSTIALGFDELGKHGAIVGNVDKEQIKLEFIAFDDREFKEINFDVSDNDSVESLIENINKLQLNDMNFYKIIFTGKRNFEINPYAIYPFIEQDNIIKIKDETKINFDIEKISTENNLCGLFIKEILEDEKNGIIDHETSERVMEIGLDILNNQ